MKPAGPAMKPAGPAMKLAGWQILFVHRKLFVWGWLLWYNL
jgi:hypothetical protein